MNQNEILNQFLANLIAVLAENIYVNNIQLQLYLNMSKCQKRRKL